MQKFAVIVAGGAGTRMGGQTPKQFLLLRGRPVIWHTLQRFLRSFDDMQVILVLPADHLHLGKEIVSGMPGAARVVVTAGGETRFHSVQKGLQWVQQPAVVFVHDGVRCLVSTALIQRCYAQALEMGNAIPAIAVTDSIRQQTTAGNIVLNRETLHSIQTPQTFRSDWLLPAFEQPWQPGFTDEATVVEAFGKPIFLVEGEADNIKITRPIDLSVAEQLLQNAEGQV
jgi:2-C-methyl-D-erythritol 4-phosphate cytidylyltransferase